jgi:hypothetical protein
MIAPRAISEFRRRFHCFGPEATPSGWAIALDLKVAAPGAAGERVDPRRAKAEFALEVPEMITR